MAQCDEIQNVLRQALGNLPSLLLQQVELHGNARQQAFELVVKIQRLGGLELQQTAGQLPEHTFFVSTAFLPELLCEASQLLGAVCAAGAEHLQHAVQKRRDRACGLRAGGRCKVLHFQPLPRGMPQIGGVDAVDMGQLRNSLVGREETRRKVGPPFQQGGEVIEYRRPRLRDFLRCLWHAEFGIGDEALHATLHGAHDFGCCRALNYIQYANSFMQALGGHAQGGSVQRGDVAAAGGGYFLAESGQLFAHIVQGVAQ